VLDLVPGVCNDLCILKGLCMLVVVLMPPVGVAAVVYVLMPRQGHSAYSALHLPPLEVALSQIQQYPCALSFTLAPLLPVRR
jgi:hypothetical protein